MPAHDGLASPLPIVRREVDAADRLRTGHGLGGGVRLVEAVAGESSAGLRRDLVVVGTPDPGDGVVARWHAKPHDVLARQSGRVEVLNETGELR